MKILQINNCHYRRGGADVVYLNTGELLESFGNEVFYFSTKNKFNKKSEFEKYFINSINFIDTTFLNKILSLPRFFYSQESKQKLNKLLNRYNPEIAHIHLYKGGLTPSILKVLNKRKIPVVISLHDYGLLDPHNLLLNGNLDISEKCINGSVFNCVIEKSNRNSYLLSLVSTIEYVFHAVFFPFEKYFDTIIAVSKFSQSKHLESKKFNWTIEHLYNFSPLFNVEEGPTKKKSKYLLYFGRLSKEKGVKTLIKAVENLNGKINLKIVGTGGLELEFEEYIRDNNISYIELLGFKKGEELSSLIKKSLFVVLPSEWYENNPMTIIESYCFSVPVIGSKIGGIPEIIDEGKTGYTYEMKNVKHLTHTIKKAINLPENEYLSMKKNARIYAEKKFSPNVHYNKLFDLYNKTIKKN